MKINRNYLNLQDSYLFSTIAKKVNAFRAANPDREIIRLGIGDVTKPLAPVVVKGLVSASEDQGRAETFHGYGAEQGCGTGEDSAEERRAGKECRSRWSPYH